VAVPKFKMTSTFMLGGTLAAMGMPLAFQAGKADFTGITGGKEPFWIGEVIHKAFVDVNEEGTEAAAATAIMMVGAAMPSEPPPVFRADHPFVFLIRDKPSGCILFLGRVVNPKE
jgi:serpin B